MKRVLVFLLLLALLPVASRTGEAGGVELRYSYRPERTTVETPLDEEGRAWIPVEDLAAFYGVRYKYQPQANRVELVRGARRVVGVVSQPFCLVEGNETVFLEPLEIVRGRLSARPEAAASLVAAVLNVRAAYLEDKNVLYVGAVSSQDLRREIEAEEQKRAIPAAKIVSAPSTPAPEPTLPGPEPKVQTISSKTLRERAYRIRKIVVDPGHGGRDGGAVGHSRRFTEKEAVLDIGKRVRDILKQEPDLEVLMTRDKDKFRSLQYRAEFANRHKADLFVSIHCNANPKGNAKGTETYVYSSRATGNAAAAAERENEGGDFLDFVEADLRHNAYRARSFYLAEKVDQRIRDRLGQKILRIEQAPFYVLARVNMPSILIETAFISHKDEEVKLKNPEWRGQIARAIADGILAYRDSVEDSLERNKAKSESAEAGVDSE